MTEQNPQTQGGRLLKRGDTFDPECYRTTYRLQRAALILKSMHIEPTWEHSDHQGVVGTGLLQRTAHTCDYRCKAVWPAEATGRMFDLAYQLADEFQTQRGAVAQRAINEARAARV